LAKNYQKSLKSILSPKVFICYNILMESQKQKNQKKITLSKKLGYRTPDRFRRKVFRRNPATSTNVRSFGGHR
jgi:hypothetical protein